jgi:uncharacterized protein (TIGR03435 family)
MSHRKCCSAVLAVAATFFCLPNQTWAQSFAENTVAGVPSYATVSIKPDKSGLQWQTVTVGPGELTVRNETLPMMIQHAYQVEADQIHGGPSWLDSEKYDVQTKVDKSAVENLQRLGPEQADVEQRQMMQAFLAEHFKLAVHRDTTSVPVYELVLADDGPKLQQSQSGDAAAQGRVIQVGNGHITGREVPISTLASLLSEQLGHTVINKTGLTNHYDVTLQWPASADIPQGTENSSATESSREAIFAAVGDQLGLKLEPHQVPMEILVIDHVEKPTED